MHPKRNQRHFPLDSLTQSLYSWGNVSSYESLHYMMVQDDTGQCRRLVSASAEGFSAERRQTESRLLFVASNERSHERSHKRSHEHVVLEDGLYVISDKPEVKPAIHIAARGAERRVAAADGGSGGASRPKLAHHVFGIMQFEDFCTRQDMRAGDRAGAARCTPLN